jgi:lysozyme
MIITEEEGERMFAKELAVYEDAIERLVKVPLNQNQFDALVSFVYNCGPGQDGLAGSTLLKLLNQGKYDHCPAQFKRWHFAGGVSYDGLVTRRAREAALFMDPMPEEALAHVEDIQEAPETPGMPQKVEEAPAGKVIEVVTQSWTLRGAALALVGAVTKGAQEAYDWVFSVVSQAGPEIATLKQTVSPLDPLVKLTPAVLYGVIVIGLIIVVIRKIQDHVEGKAV